MRDNTAGADRLAIDYTGNVGIGTNGPTSKLSVAGNILAGRGTVTGGLSRSFVLAGARGNQEAPYAMIQFQNFDDNTDPNVDYIGAEIRSHNDVIGNAGDLRFFVNDGVGTSEGMRIQRDGRVGIGTTSPSNTLSVAGDADFSGNVGIGTTTPSASLHVEETGDGASTMFSLRRNADSNSNLQVVSFNLDPTNAVFHLDVGGSGNASARIHLGDPSTGSNDVTMLGNVGSRLKPATA